MKNTNSLKIGLLLLGILTITTNCDKEKIIDNPIEESNNAGIQIERISSKDAPQVINAITSLTGKSSLKSTSYSKTLSYKKAHIDIDHILKIKNHKNITNYTFNVLVENSQINEFYNLIVNEDSDKKLKNPYVIKYVVDDDALDKFLANNSDFSYFKGKQSVLSFDSFFDSFDLSSSKSAADPCIETTVDYTASGVSGGPGGSGSYFDIANNNLMQTDAYSYSYGTPNAGDSYSMYFNSNNTTTQEPTSYGATVTNNNPPIWIDTRPSELIQLPAASSNLNGIRLVYQTVVITPFSSGSGHNGNIIRLYSDGSIIISWWINNYTAPAQQKQTVFDPCPIPEGEIGVVTISEASKVITDCLLKPNLTPDQFYFVLKDLRNIELGNYLYNNCTPESKEFAFLAIDANLASGEVDYVDKIIDNLTGKADCVYKKLQNNNFLAKTLEKFVGEKTPVNLILNQKSNLRKDDNDPNSPLVNGLTEYGTSYYITITLNTEQASNRPSLDVARTILHEAIHAEIFRKIKTTSGLHLNSLGQWVLGDGAKADFPTLFDYYENHNDPQHEYMADYYRAAMEVGLKKYAISIGQTYPDQLYKDLAWSGLRDTYAWANMFADYNYTLSEQLRISTAVNNFLKNKTNECE